MILSNLNLQKTIIYCKPSIINSSIQNAIIYCRSSTINQNKFNHYSLDTQIFICKEYCNINNLNVVDIKFEICRANKINNQKVLINTIENINNINLIIFDTSRFSRNIYDGIHLLKKCHNKNIIIHVVKDNYNTQNIKGYNKFKNDLKNSENESNLISDRINSSIKYRKSLGTRFGKPSFGFKSVKINNITKFIINNDENKIINFAKKLYYGCKYSYASRIIKEITGKKMLLLFTEPCKNILYGNFTYKMIAEFFNQNKIKNRLKHWTSQSICRIIKCSKTVLKNIK